MSWQTYVDSNLLGTKKVAKAAIFGHDKSQWATSTGFSVDLFDSGKT
jgi:profilin